jgi:hypothetical protein
MHAEWLARAMRRFSSPRRTYRAQANGRGTPDRRPASKFTPPHGKIRCAVATVPAAEGRRVAIAISDTGIGISKEMLPRGFRRAPDKARRPGGSRTHPRTEPSEPGYLTWSNCCGFHGPRRRKGVRRSRRIRSFNVSNGMPEAGAASGTPVTKPGGANKCMGHHWAMRKRAILRQNTAASAPSQK